MQCRLSSTSLSRKAGRCARLLCLLLWWSHLWIGSAMPQRAPPKMTKTWCPLNTPMIRLYRTLIPDNQPLRRGTTQDSMEVADCVSASRMDSQTLTVYFRIIIIAHCMCYICSRELVVYSSKCYTSGLLEECTILHRIMVRPEREHSNQTPTVQTLHKPCTEDFVTYLERV
jgi:hypothetical protein